MTLQTTLRRLLRAVRRLQDPQGRIARRNARAAVYAELRRISKALDAEFPPIAKTAPAAQKRRRKPGTPPQRWHAVSAERAASLLKDGLSPHRLWQGKKEIRGFYTEPWIGSALAAGIHNDQIVEASRSVKARRKLDAYIRLGGGK